MRSAAAVIVALLAVASFSQPADAQQSQPQNSGSASFTADAAQAAKGKPVYAARLCASCHTIGKGKLVGPDLKGVFERRDVEWLRRWLKDPPALLQSDKTAQALLKEYNGIAMPNLNLTDPEIEALLHYIASEQNSSR